MSYGRFGSVHGLAKRGKLPPHIQEVLIVERIRNRQLVDGNVETHPLLAGNTLVLVADQRANSFILAVDARNGKVLWKKDRTNYEGFSTPVVYTPKNAPAQLVVLGSNSLDGYSLDKGERLWWVTKVGTYPKGVPALSGDMVYVNGEGADEPFFPPYEESLKKYDKDNNQRIQPAEMKSDPLGRGS